MFETNTKGSSVSICDFEQVNLYIYNVTVLQNINLFNALTL